MSQDSKLPVAIIGAGPVGLAAAADLVVEYLAPLAAVPSIRIGLKLGVTVTAITKRASARSRPKVGIKHHSWCAISMDRKSMTSCQRT